MKLVFKFRWKVFSNKHFSENKQKKFEVFSNTINVFVRETIIVRRKAINMQLSQEAGQIGLGLNVVVLVFGSLTRFDKII